MEHIYFRNLFRMVLLSRLALVHDSWHVSIQYCTMQTHCYTAIYIAAVRNNVPYSTLNVMHIQKRFEYEL
jgi:hypothetical protein